MSTPLIRLTACSLIALGRIAGADGDSGVTVSHWGNALIVTAPESAEDAHVRGALSQRVSVDFKDSTVTEVANFLHTVTNLNIVVDPKLVAADTRLTLQAQKLELGSVLHWVETLAKVHVNYVDSVVYLSQDRYQGKLVTRFYDVTDLVTPVRDFPGPELAFNESTGHQENPFLAPPAQNDKPVSTIEDFEDLVRSQALRESNH